MATSDMVSEIRGAERSFLSSILSPVISQTVGTASNALQTKLASALSGVDKAALAKPGPTASEKLSQITKSGEDIYSPNYGENLSPKKPQPSPKRKRENPDTDDYEQTWADAAQRLENLVMPQRGSKPSVVFVDGRDREVVARLDDDMVRTVTGTSTIRPTDRKVLVVASKDATLQLPKLDTSVGRAVANQEYTRGSFVTIINKSLTTPHIIRTADGDIFQNNERSIRLSRGQTRTLCGIGNTWVLA